ncbi:tRNA (N6-isopentenyl adenosine(37)-C2)-methylthiotransferase MiaB [Gottschalkiaceae bacterium SANA]|nr:tRNA (N6-isopentenyl adenosine(37)-C2)-methylthiotransferase MiaB [Gottschalkiaceae bacterium SANA]
MEEIIELSKESSTQTGELGITVLNQWIRENYREQGLTYIIKTWGCQMNERDSEIMAGVVEECGYRRVTQEEEADLIVYNTCLIRENAEMKVFGNLGQLKALKKKNPKMRIALCGCMAQKEHIVAKLKKSYPHVDLVFGTHNIHELPMLLLESYRRNKRQIHVLEDGVKTYQNLPSRRLFDFKGFVNIMYGCNNFCSYCVVPYTRGREQSRSKDEILAEVEAMAHAGYQEITLLGQNVNSYGNDLDSSIVFSDLLEEIVAVDGIKRIRFMTSHPKDISTHLIDVMAKHPTICNQLHLPIQAGSNRVLEKMNRKYTKESYLKMLNYAKATIPDLTISTDLIVGFPGETEEDFQDTLAMVEEAEYDFAFSYLYSPREGTPAAMDPNQVPDDVKHHRFDRLMETVNPIFLRKNEALVGSSLTVLVEGVSKNDASILNGRTEGSKLIHFPGDPDLIGSIVRVKVKRAQTFILFGEVE